MTHALRLYLSETEVSARLGVSRPTLTRWRRLTRNGAPVGPPARVMGPRRVLYSVAELEAWEAASAHRTNGAQAAA